MHVNNRSFAVNPQCRIHILPQHPQITSAFFLRTLPLRTSAYPQIRTSAFYRRPLNFYSGQKERNLASTFNKCRLWATLVSKLDLYLGTPWKPIKRLCSVILVLTCTCPLIGWWSKAFNAHILAKTRLVGSWTGSQTVHRQPPGVTDSTRWPCVG